MELPLFLVLGLLSGYISQHFIEVLRVVSLSYILLLLPPNEPDPLRVQTKVVKMTYKYKKRDQEGLLKLWYFQILLVAGVTAFLQYPLLPRIESYKKVG